MSQRFMFTFNDVSSYEKYKKEVQENGGTIVNDLGPTIRGFTADITPTLVASLSSLNLIGSGITSFEPDSVATIQ